VQLPCRPRITRREGPLAMCTTRLLPESLRTTFRPTNPRSIMYPRKSGPVSTGRARYGVSSTHVRTHARHTHAYSRVRHPHVQYRDIAELHDKIHLMSRHLDGKMLPGSLASEFDASDGIGVLVLLDLSLSLLPCCSSLVSLPPLPF